MLQQLEAVNNQLREIDAEKNDLLGIIAHDLKNPLSAIRLLARVLKQAYRQNDDITEIGEDIEKNCDRMFELIYDLLKANQIESGTYRLHPESINVEETVVATLARFEMAALLKEIVLKTEIGEDVKPVLADRNALFQVLDNLVSNAVKYSPAQTNITVKILQLPETMRVIIQDEGPGLTEEDKARLFQKFAKLSAQTTGGEHSTGLGLYIVKKLTESMNGRITCESEPGMGAAFIVELPSIHETVEA